jgi:hypothetical protein
MPTTRRLAIVVGTIFALCCSHPLPAAQPSAKPSASEPATQFKRPELLAIAWASAAVQPVADGPLDKSFTGWRPDGVAIPSDELASIKKELREFGALGKAEPDRLPPLHLVFRIDERAKNSQRLTPRLMIGKRPVESLAVQEGSSAGHLALSVLALSREPMAHWPPEIDVEVRVPIEEGEVFKTVDRLNDSPFTIAPGARLVWTKVAVMDRTGQKLLPAVALEVDRQQTDLVDYDFFTHWKDGTAHSFNAVQSNETHDLRVSPPLETREDLDHIDVWRLRYRAEVYSRLPIFPERIPKKS